VLAVHAATSTALASGVTGRSQPHIAAEVRICILHHDLGQSRIGALGLRAAPRRVWHACGTAASAPGQVLVRCITRLYAGPMASVKQFQVTFDCAEPERVARFWCEVLGYVVPPPPAGFATWDDFDRSLPPEDQGSWFACIDPSGVGPRLFFQRVPEGKVVKNRVHLDVRVGTGLVGEERLAVLEAECARLVALGAVRVRLLYDGSDSCIVMQDIEGNEFDLD
jgi:Glyoxalase-like domain